MSERCLMDRILEPGALSVRFQPVYEAHATVMVGHYVECLIRGPRGTSVESPEILFEYARKKSREAVVDRRCVSVILEACLTLPSHVRIGLNVHASTLALDTGFVEYLAGEASRLGIETDRLVVEVVEHAPPWDVAGFRRALHEVRDLGAAIALDDVGLGHSNFMMILECRPNYFKIDRYFVCGARTDIYRQAVLASVAQLARPFDARVVAEGVETVADLETVRKAGINLVQGYLFGQPGTTADLNPPRSRFSARPLTPKSLSTSMEISS
jgi:EAL domain-containing protein (putative c-di-GMP-specific phosphodiesterase class I)